MKKILLSIIILSILVPFICFAKYIPDEIVDLTNEYRIENGLTKLKVDSTLNLVAGVVANYLVITAQFSHNGFGLTPWYWLNLFGYKYIWAGQNLARGFIDTESNVKAWIDSETHRANILSKNFNKIGIGMVKDKNGIIYVVQYFTN